MTDAETMDAMIVKLAVNSARVEERKACAEMRDDHRDLQRAAHDLCSTLRLFDASLSRETAVCVSILETMLEFFDPTEE